LTYRPEIDGLRALAVVAVIVYHAEFSVGGASLLSGGFLGVDVFFVISGFLITSLIRIERESTGSFSFARFYERRARRLLPALLTVSVPATVFGWLFLMPMQLIDFSRSMLYSLGFASNFHWVEALDDYGAQGALYQPFLHTWSLAVEEQFYLVYPILLLALYRIGRRATAGGLAALGLASFSFALISNVEAPGFSFYMLPTRFWELLIGGLLAHLPPATGGGAKRFVPGLGLVAIAVPLAAVDFGPNHPGWVTLAPVLGTAAVIRYARPRDGVTALLSSKAFTAVGLLSYSLYLWHFPIFAFARSLHLEPSGLDKLLWIALSVALSLLSYRWVEQPCRNRRRVPGLAFAGVTITVTGILAGVSMFAIDKDGLPDRFADMAAVYGHNEYDNRILQVRSWEPLNELAASRGYGPCEANKVCDFERTARWFSTDPNTTKVLIVGNSHSKDLFNALYLNRDLFPAYEFARYTARDTPRGTALDDYLASPNFRAANLVLFSSRYHPALFQTMPGFIEAHREADKPLAILSNTVEFNSPTREHVERFALRSEETTFFTLFDVAVRSGQGLSPDVLEPLYFRNVSSGKDAWNRAMKSIADAGDVGFFDKREFLCEDERRRCVAVTDSGHKVFYDYGHWTTEGARFIGQRIHATGWLARVAASAR